VWLRLLKGSNARNFELRFLGWAHLPSHRLRPWHSSRRSGCIGPNPAGERQHPGSCLSALPCVRRRDPAPSAPGGDIVRLLPRDASHPLRRPRLPRAVATCQRSGYWPWRRWRDRTERRVGLAVRLDNFSPPWQVPACPRATPLGLHQRPLACSKALFYGAFSKPFYYGGEGGIFTPVSDSHTSVNRIALSWLPVTSH
jgi:hypothetical protein